MISYQSLLLSTTVLNDKLPLSVSRTMVITLYVVHNKMAKLPEQHNVF